MRERYKKQVNLLIDMLPIVLKDKRMALKGGTAINLFHEELPRLSVDIDLCYLNLEDRETTFKHLHEILFQIKEDLENNFGASVNVTNPLDEKKESKLIVVVGDIEIKIEPNYTIRGSLFDSVELEMSKTAVNEFDKTTRVKCLSFADTYGGKLCAALDRQHPRDLFDVKFFFEKTDISIDIKNSFLFYLLSHNRPINEILNPNLKDITEQYERSFVEMSSIDTSIKELENTRGKLISEIKNNLDLRDKEFLISFANNEPNWNLFDYEKIKNYPSVKWKLFNQDKMSDTKHKKYVNLLANYLE
jgi:predicted nucleotidyltransferase component of viral defense system